MPLSPLRIPFFTDLLWAELPKSQPQEVQDWLLKAPLAYINGCSRRTLIGHSGDLADFPDMIKRQVTPYVGIDAYVRALECVTGLISKARGETQIVSQFKRACQQYLETNPLGASPLEPLYQAVLADNATIRNGVTAGLKPAYYENAAEELLERRAGDSVLLVADRDPHSARPCEMTRNLVRQMASRSAPIKRLIVTHPDDAALPSISGWLTQEKLRGSLHCEIKPVPFAKAMDACGVLGEADRMAVTYPMDKNPAADRTMIDEWAQRAVFGGKMVHLGNNRKAQRMSAGAWKDADLYHYSPPEQVVAQQHYNQLGNDHLADRGQRACINCATSRLYGKRPIGSMLELLPEVYAERTGIGRTGRGLG